jgi:pyridoxal phosphate enzyme (YggS family)
MESEMDMSTAIGERVAHVQERIVLAAKRAGREPSEVLLIAVTKTHGIEVIQAAFEAGLRHFGENRVEEGKDKVVAAVQLLPEPVTWHMIGHIQSRKTAGVSSSFSWVHSLDRLKVARKLSQSAVALERTLDVLLQVNLSGEESKEGYMLSRWPDDQGQEKILLEDIEVIADLPGLRIQGLMTMPPLAFDAEQVRPIFRRLRVLCDSLRKRFPSLTWQHLSMGMSGDFEAAIEEGATMVRLGTVLFGERYT